MLSKRSGAESVFTRWEQEPLLGAQKILAGVVVLEGASGPAHISPVELGSVVFIFLTRTLAWRHFPN